LAIAVPIPFDAPVTIATFPSSLPAIALAKVGFFVFVFIAFRFLSIDILTAKATDLPSAEHLVSAKGAISLLAWHLVPGI